MKMSPRSQKLSGIVDAQVGPILQRLFTPDEVGFLTVTAVEVSGDLGVADIFIRSLGGPGRPVKFLNTQAKKVANELQKVLDLRRTMIVRFKEDKSVEAVKIFEK